MLANPPTDPMLSHNHLSIAWVSDLLQDSSGKYIGFLMPEIANCKPLSSICNPKLRKRKAPGFNWYYLHVTALNTAWIIQEIHAKGYVLGDIKLENILVSDRAMTAVIDTDSFQVRDSSAKKVYRCTVGSEGFTPPELIGKDFSTTNQSANQDRFRLAVLIHYLLFGYHPFSGSWTGVGECPEQSQLIEQGYWYGGHNSPIRPNTATIPLGIVHPELQKLFFRCFNDGHTQPYLRPTAEDWHRALKVAVDELVSCSRIDSHHHSQHCGSCYWCERATNLGIDIFPGISNTTLFSAPIELNYQKIYIKRALFSSYLNIIPAYSIVHLLASFLLFLTDIQSYHDDPILFIYTTMTVGFMMYNLCSSVLLRNNLIILNIKGLITKKEAKRINLKFSIITTLLLLVFGRLIISVFLFEANRFWLAIVQIFMVAMPICYLNSVYDTTWNRIKLEIKNNLSK